MFEKFSEKQEKVQEKVQKQQELNDDKSRELTDEELEQIVGGTATESDRITEPLIQETV